MSKVAAYVLQSNSLARMTVPLLAAGARAIGDQVRVFADTDYTEQHVTKYDSAIFWGYVATCQNIMNGYRDAGKSAVYLDHAYWNRGESFKVSVNSRHPTDYFQRYKHSDGRRKMFGVDVKHWRNDGTAILVAGMGAKAAWAEKCEPVESWERAAIVELRKHTDRKIVYRPKPSWSGAKPIEGAIFDRSKYLDLSRYFAVVTHHSNVAVDAQMFGVPTFAWFGVATPMSHQHLEYIEKPYYPPIVSRERWLNDVAYCQWTKAELEDGTCWRHLKDEGLVS